VRTIKIDDEVWEILKKTAVPFEDEPIDALRRLLNLPNPRSSSPRGQSVAPANPSGAKIGVSQPPQGPRFDRSKIEEQIIAIIKDRGGQTAVKDHMSGFNIYEEVAHRLGLARELLKELTPTGENRWRAEVGFARKNLEQRGVIAPTSQSGRGVWRLK
jgi:hypothetical protein